MSPARILGVLLLAGVTSGSGASAGTHASLAGRWQYLQPPDVEGEVLDLSFSSGRWRGVMNGLERAGEHGLFYYVVEVESLVVTPEGAIRFAVGARSLYSRRPAPSALDSLGDAGITRDRLRYAGRLEAGDLVLRCVGPSGSCPDSSVRFRRVAPAPKPGQPATSDSSAFTLACRFSVTDTTAVHEHPLGRQLLIRVVREPPLGWIVSVEKKSSSPDEPNLLYPRGNWHGPYPTDVFAVWHQRRFYPDERHLAVRGHPYEIRIRLVDCRTSGTDDRAVFEAGTIEVGWRRTKMAARGD